MLKLLSIRVNLEWFLMPKLSLRMWLPTWIQELAWLQIAKMPQQPEEAFGMPFRQAAAMILTLVNQRNTT